MTPNINIAPLRNALARLNEAIMFWQRCEPEDPLKPHLRSAVIQSFEFTYELSIRLTRRVLTEGAESADLVRELGFSDLIRFAGERGLPMQLDRWRQWREMRNSTSHAYDELRAQAVVGKVGEFVQDASLLLAKLAELVDRASSEGL